MGVTDMLVQAQALRRITRVPGEGLERGAQPNAVRQRALSGSLRLRLVGWDRVRLRVPNEWRVSLGIV